MVPKVFTEKFIKILKLVLIKAYFTKYQSWDLIENLWSTFHVFADCVLSNYCPTCPRFLLFRVRIKTRHFISTKIWSPAENRKHCRQKLAPYKVYPLANLQRTLEKRKLSSETFETSVRLAQWPSKHHIRCF